MWVTNKTTIMIPQILILSLFVLAIVTAIVDNGKEKKVNAVSSTIACILEMIILYYGGFFDSLFK